MHSARSFATSGQLAPDVPVIYDAKRGDIGNTNLGYATDAFDRLGADAITVHPYLGREALKPFLDRPDKGVIVLVRTSNPGGGEFQDLEVDGEPLYRVVARRVAESWNAHRNCAVVVGADLSGGTEGGSRDRRRHADPDPGHRRPGRRRSGPPSRPGATRMAAA